MQRKTSQKIVIMGCGNLAWHLAKKFGALKNTKVFIYNHQPNPALADFEKKLKCNVSGSFTKIVKDADLYLVCVSDKYIESVSKKIVNISSSASVLHTSGSIGLNALKSKTKNKGVLYPVQTFSKAIDVNWKETPFAIEASNEETLKKIKQLAESFSKKTTVLNSEERLKLHLAAVLVNNFTNSLFASAKEVLPASVSFKLLLPLIEQTIVKLKKLDPIQAQTGPAKRNDKKVMDQHLQLLNNNERLKKIYKQLSKLIKQQANSNEL